MEALREAGVGTLEADAIVLRDLLREEIRKRSERLERLSHRLAPGASEMSDLGRKLEALTQLHERIAVDIEGPVALKGE